MWALPDVPAEPPPGRAASTEPPVRDDGSLRGRPGSIRTPIPLHPAGIAEIFDGGFEAIKLRPQTLIGLSALFTLPVQAVLVWLSRASGSGAFATQSASSFDLGDIGPGELFVLYIGGGLSLAWTTAAVSLLLSSWYAGQDRTDRELVVAALKRTHHLMIAWVAVHLFQLVFVFLGVVTVAVGAAFTLSVTPAMVVENVGPFKAIDRSFRLARSEFGRGLGFVLVAALLVAIITPVLGLIPWFLVDQYDLGGEWLIATGVATGGVILINAFLSAATTLFYLDLRVRTEGVDLVLQLPDRFDRRIRPR